MAKQALRARPSVASYMAMFGSFIIFLAGLLSIILPRYVAPAISLLSGALGMPSFGIASGLLGMLFAVGIAFCAVKTNVKDPREVKRWSVIAAVLSILSLMDFGGLWIGFVLAFTGSIMALTYNS